jgi:hypothetical protein
MSAGQAAHLFGESDHRAGLIRAEEWANHQVNDHPRPSVVPSSRGSCRLCTRRDTVPHHGQVADGRLHGTGTNGHACNEDAVDKRQPDAAARHQQH